MNLNVEGQDIAPLATSFSIDRAASSLQVTGLQRVGAIR